MTLFKKVWGWLFALLFWLWAVLPRAMDWVGRTTLPDDWEGFMDDKLPAALRWLFSTPGWVPAVIAVILTAWLIWASWPRKLGSAPHPDANLIKQQRLAAKEKRVAATALQKPLTPHAVEQKIKVIDQAIELMRDAPTFRERLKNLFQDPWQRTGKSTPPDGHSFSDQVGALREDVIAFAKPLSAMRYDYAALYPDIAAALEQTYLQSTTERLAEYQNACREVEVIASKGGSIGDVNFMYSQFVGRTEQAVLDILAWREGARNALVQIRNAISGA